VRSRIRSNVKNQPPLRGRCVSQRPAISSSPGRKGEIYMISRVRAAVEGNRRHGDSRAVAVAAARRE
jgi:hypothetical protein